MFKLIEKIRQKPEKTKKQIAFLVAFLFCGVIFAVWLSVILPDFRDSQARVKRAESESPSPISSFADSFKEGISAIGEQLNSIKSMMSGSTTTNNFDESSTTEMSSTSTEMVQNDTLN